VKGLPAGEPGLVDRAAAGLPRRMPAIVTAAELSVPFRPTVKDQKHYGG
jgi:hypothetical protein